MFSAGRMAWYLPDLRQQLARAWGPEVNIDELIPVPEWIQTAIDQSVPLGTDYMPVDPLQTQYLAGQISHSEHQTLWAASEVTDYQY